MATNLRTILHYELAQASESVRQIKDMAISEGTYINPRLPAWQDYCKAKDMASALLTAIAILKYFGSLPEKKGLRKAIRARIKSLYAHSGKSKNQSQFIFSAHFIAESLENRHVRNPESVPYLQKVEEWAAKREAEAKARKEDDIELTPAQIMHAWHSMTKDAENAVGSGI